jgi:hypothetical protein
MAKIDDRDLARTHVVVVTSKAGKVTTQGPVPQTVARAQAAAMKGKPGIRSAVVKPKAK